MFYVSIMSFSVQRFLGARGGDAIRPCTAEILNVTNERCHPAGKVFIPARDIPMLLLV
jgi:hypothetical protein